MITEKKLYNIFVKHNNLQTSIDLTVYPDGRWEISDPRGDIFAEGDTIADLLAYLDQETTFDKLKPKDRFKYEGIEYIKAVNNIGGYNSFCPSTGFITVFPKGTVVEKIS